MDGLIGNYGDASDEEENNMEYEEEVKLIIEEEVPTLSGEIESSPPHLHDYPESPLPSSNTSSFNSQQGLVSYTSQSPGRPAVPRTALTSLLASYDEADKSMLEEKDEEDIEKQYDVTLENSDSDSDTENFMGRMDENGNAKVPPCPKGKCSSKLQDQISELLQKKRDGYDFCVKMQVNKEFRNPSIYDKLIDMIGIQETGTNFPDPIFHKSSWKPDSFYKQLADKQQKEYDRKEAEKKKERENDPNAKIKQIVIAEKEKRSKWDEKADTKDKLFKANQIKDKLNKQIAEGKK